MCGTLDLLISERWAGPMTISGPEDWPGIEEESHDRYTSRIPPLSLSLSQLGSGSSRSHFPSLPFLPHHFFRPKQEKTKNNPDPPITWAHPPPHHQRPGRRKGKEEPRNPPHRRHRQAADREFRLPTRLRPGRRHFSVSTQRDPYAARRFSIGPPSTQVSRRPNCLPWIPVPDPIPRWLNRTRISRSTSLGSFVVPVPCQAAHKSRGCFVSIGLGSFSRSSAPEIGRSRFTPGAPGTSIYGRWKLVEVSCFINCRGGRAAHCHIYVHVIMCHISVYVLAWD